MAPFLPLASISQHLSSIQLIQQLGSHGHHFQTPLLNLTSLLQPPTPQAIETEYHLLNHVGSFFIDKSTGDIFLRQSLYNYSYIIDVRVDVRVTTSSDAYDTQAPLTPEPIKKSSTFRYSTKVPILLEIIDINNSDPESSKTISAVQPTITSILKHPYVPSHSKMTTEVSTQN